MAQKDYYEILGVKRDASRDEISKAYRKAALKYHPDRQQGKSEAEKKEAEERFKECSEAASVLTDDEKRARYDRFGTADPGQGFGGGEGFDPFSFFRSFHGFGGGFEDDMFSDFGFSPFGFGGRRRDSEAPDPNAPRNGETVKMTINVDFAMTLYGGTSEFTIDLTDLCEKCKGTGAKDGILKPCHACNGTGMETVRRGMMIMSSTCRCCHGSGQESSAEHCPECGGSGRMNRKHPIKVNIPRGISTGARILLSGEGGRGVNGGATGDVIVTVMVSGNGSPYSRDGNDLKTMLPISPLVATLGGTVDVETPWGTEKLEIPRDTRSGKTFRIKGHGIRLSGGLEGDLVVTVIISSLVNLTKDQEKVLKNLENALSDRNVAVLEESNLVKRKFRSLRK